MLHERLEELRQVKAQETQFIEWLNGNQFETLNQFCEQHYPTWLKSKESEQEPLLYPQVNISSLCDMDFLLSKFASKQALHAKLKAWHQVAPSFFSAFLLGELWVKIVEAERGASTANHVSHKAWQRAHWARDMAFYWELTAIEQDPQKVWSYFNLLNVTGYLGLPDWLSTYWANDEMFADYIYPIDEARAFFESYGENDIVPMRQFPTNLPAPTEEEINFPLNYWFNRITAISPSYFRPYEVYLYYLYPRWYGDEYHDIDAFLASPVCQALPKEKYNALLFTKAWDLIEYFAEFGSETQQQQEEIFKQLLPLPYINRVKVSLFLHYIRFCNEYVLNTDIERHARTQEYAQTLVMTAEELLAQYEKDLYWDDTTHFVGNICWWFTGVRNVLGEDHTQLRKRVIQLFASRSPFVKALEVGATELGIWGFEKGQIEVDWKALIVEDRDESYDIDNALRYFAMDGYAQYSIALYKKLAELGHAFSQYRLYQIQQNLYLPEFFAPYSDQLTEEEGETFLAKAVEQGLTRALVTFGVREYERLWPIEKRPKAEAERALSALKQAVELKQTEAYIPYIHLLYLETDAGKEDYIFRELAPELMVDCEFSQEDFAWLANLYAVAFKEGFGVEKNHYVSLFWSEKACLLEPNNETFQQFFKDLCSPTGIFFAKSRFEKKLERDKAQIPEWVMPVADHFIQLSSAYETSYPLWDNFQDEEDF